MWRRDDAQTLYGDDRKLDDVTLEDTSQRDESISRSSMKTDLARIRSTNE